MSHFSAASSSGIYMDVCPVSNRLGIAWDNRRRLGRSARQCEMSGVIIVQSSRTLGSEGCFGNIPLTSVSRSVKKSPDG